MKRTATLLVLMLLPLSLASMNPISDSDLSKVTGQAGVTINIDVAMNVAFSEVGWGDTDGIPATSAAGGWIGINDLKMNNLHIWPRTDFAMESPDFGGSPEANGDGGLSDVQFATVDVVTLPDDTGTAMPVVRAGIPTLTIAMDSMFVNIVLGPFATDSTINGSQTTNRPNFNQIMGQLYIGGLNMATGKDGAAFLSPHGTGRYISSYADEPTSGILYGSGVDIVLENMKVDYLLMNEFAWGDIDGYYDRSTVVTSHDTAGMSNPGWVGLKDMAIRDITINGKVLIDMGTYAIGGGDGVATAADFEDLLNSMDEHYEACLGTPNRSFTSIKLANNFNIRMEEMGAKVQLGETHDLGKTMGDIYILDMRMTILDNPDVGNRSYVHIFAH